MATPHKLACLKSNKTKSSDINFDLGKPTRRGTKKCPDCGCINGTKSYTCKNTFCNRILKHTDRHKIQIDAIKLLTGRNRQIYSVRACDKTHDIVKQRGFVQLPCTIFERDKLNEVALCFVSHCQRSYSILKCHENDNNEETGAQSMNFCAHIAAAVRSLTIGQALDFKHDLINNLKACESIKRKLCALANSSTEGPLVQCVARNVMAIKCFVNSAYPLGYLHFSLEVKKSAGGELGEELDGGHAFHCECSMEGKCLHYYACVCAFASDAKYLQQYQGFIQEEFDSSVNLDVTEVKDQNYNMDNIQIEILCTDLLDLQQMNNNNSIIIPNSEKPSSTAKQTNIPNSSKCRQPIQQNIKILSNNLLQTSCIPTTNNPNKKQGTEQIEPNLSTHEILTYNEWLTSVIERINYSSSSVTSMFLELDDFCPSNIMDMHEVKLEFHIPEKFFEVLKRHLYAHLGNYTQDGCGDNDCDDFGVISTMHFAVHDVSKLEMLFTLEDVKLATYQLLVGVEWPFRIAWTGNLYKLSQFGELQLAFYKHNGNNC